MPDCDVLEVGNDAEERVTWLQDTNPTFYLDYDNPLPAGYITSFAVYVHKPESYTTKPEKMKFNIIIWRPTKLWNRGNPKQFSVHVLSQLQWRSLPRMNFNKVHLKFKI